MFVVVFKDEIFLEGEEDIATAYSTFSVGYKTEVLRKGG